MSALESFFQEVDTAWRWPAPQKQRLRIIGSAALMLQTSYVRGTKDSDVLQTLDLTDETKSRLLSVAGAGSSLHARRRLYLDIVANGLPLLPQVPRWHALPHLSSALRHFEVEVLDVVDVVVSKLKRFSANDLGDVTAMIDQDLVPHAELVARFQDAIQFAMDARGSDVPQYVRNLNRLERDEYLVAETVFELPGWLDD